MKKKLLLIRVDRIGDLVLTLPVDQQDELKRKYDILWWISQGLEFVLEASREPRQFLSIKKEGGWKEFWHLFKVIRAVRPHIAVIFQAPWWISLLCFLAGVRVRGGRRSQWHSYLFLNKGLRQSRSQSDKHESEYNFELLNHVLNIHNPKRPHLDLFVPESKTILNKFGLQAKKYYVVHPGMAGSSRNANTSFYLQVIKNYSEKDTVVITGTKADLPYIEPLKEKLSGEQNILWLNEKLNGRELIAVVQESIATVAPSTGVVHLAASTGTKTLGIYSPVQTQWPRRWGPRGNDIQIFKPNVTCPGTRNCLFKACPHFDCMDSLKPEALLEH